jgi:putative MATE family efflux protein
MKKRPDLLSDPVAPTLIKLTAPMLIAMVGMVAFNMADTFFIGQLGTAPLAAISFTFPVIFVISSISMGLGVGAGAVISRAIGEKNKDRVRRLTTDALVLAFIVVLLISAVGIVTITPLFTAMGAKHNLLPLIHDYMHIWYMSMPFLVIPMVGNGAIRATGDTKTPALIMLLAVGINIALDPLLIFGLGPVPAFGIQGAAITTMASRAITLAASLYILGRRDRMLRFDRPAPADVIESWRSILYIGLPASLTNLIVPASMALVTRFVAEFGIAAVAGFGVATRLEMLPLTIINALGAILVPFIGQNFGAGKTDRIRDAVKISLGFSLGVGAVAVGIFLVYGSTIASWFNNHPKVIETVVLYGTVVGAGWGLQGIISLSSASFNALNKPLPGTALALIRMVALYVPLAWGLSIWFGIKGVFIAALIANIVTGAIAALWIRKSVSRIRKNSDTVL